MEHRLTDVIGWKVIAASVRGASHAGTGVPCQDAYAVGRAPDGRLIIAVADGAGSAPLGEVGSSAAVRAAVDRLSTGPSPPGCPEEGAAHLLSALAAARDAVAREAEKRGCELRDLATTLQVVLASAGLLLAAQIGDGAIVALMEDGELRLVTSPRHGEYANTTVFLTGPDYAEHAQLAAVAGPVRAAACFTDGLERLALEWPGPAPYGPFFGPLFRFAGAAGELEDASARLASFLASPRIADRTDDDLTLVIATLAPAGGAAG